MRLTINKYFFRAGVIPLGLAAFWACGSEGESEPAGEPTAAAEPEIASSGGVGISLNPEEAETELMHLSVIPIGRVQGAVGDGDHAQELVCRRGLGRHRRTMSAREREIGFRLKLGRCSRCGWSSSIGSPNRVEAAGRLR